MTDTTPLRIKRIEIEGLFGLYHHVIDLNLEDRVTILHGPNGVGKTIILRMLEAMLNDKLDFFYTIPLEKFSVEFVDRNPISIDRSSIENSRSGLSLEQLFPYPGLLNDIRQTQVHFIEEQRLFRCFNIQESLEKIGFIPTLNSQQSKVSILAEYAKDLHNKIRDAMADYGQESQNLDRTLPQRFLNGSLLLLNTVQLKGEMIALDNKQRELRDIGLPVEVSDPTFNIEQLNTLSDTTLRIMILYVSEMKKKLSILDNFAQRIKLFLDNINRKFRNKKIAVDHEKGFIIQNYNQELLPLTSLSSGEQHELVLMYDLLFRVAPNSLVLIDEPELSLHISWQQYFLPDLLEIVKISNFDVIIATHSPFIIGSRRDLMVALEDKVQ